MEEKIVKELQDIVGTRWVDTDPDRVRSYSEEYTSDAFDLISPKPAEDCVVVKPKNAEEISEILKYANENLIPVIPKGGATAIAANGIPIEPSVILVLERMNKKIEVDETNLMVTCDTAVTLGDLIETMDKHEKLYFPLHPGDEGAQIGGMAIMNAGGVRAVRDGIMRDQIRGLKAVLPTGEIVSFGNKTGKLKKNNAGYDLMQLMIGSEGTLGVVTEVTLNLKPKSNASATLVISFESRKDAFSVVPKILQEGIKPMAIEYVGKDSIIETAKDLGKDWPTDKGEGHLMIIMEENTENDLFEYAQQIEEIAKNFNSIDTRFADTEQEQRNLLEIRSHFVMALDDRLIDIPDITVPISLLDTMMSKIEMLTEKHDAEISMLAHAGDGNLHPFIMQKSKEDTEIPDYYEKFKRELYEVTIELGGTITGEHGIGYLRKEELYLQYSPKEIELMKAIKKSFDPNNILNPGKMLDL